MFTGVGNRAVQKMLEKHPFYQEKVVLGASFLDAFNATTESDTLTVSYEEEKHLLQNQ